VPTIWCKGQLWTFWLRRNRGYRCAGTGSIACHPVTALLFQDQFEAICNSKTMGLDLHHFLDWLTKHCTINLTAKVSLPKLMHIFAISNFEPYSADWADYDFTMDFEEFCEALARVAAVCTMAGNFEEAFNLSGQEAAGSLAQFLSLCGADEPRKTPAGRRGPTHKESKIRQLSEARVKLMRMGYIPGNRVVHEVCFFRRSFTCALMWQPYPWLCQVRGHGVIAKLEAMSPNPVHVQFDNGEIHRSELCGRAT
jgi:hypothetical protein